MPRLHERRETQERSTGRLLLMGTVVILILAGAVYSYGEKNAWEFTWDALLGRPAAEVNGEPVTRSALRERTDVSRRMVERQYGKELFAGDRGRALLAELERDVLEKMVEERLVAQEARRLKITVGDERVQQELQTIAQGDIREPGKSSRRASGKTASPRNTSPITSAICCSSGR